MLRNRQTDAKASQSDVGRLSVEAWLEVGNVPEAGAMPVPIERAYVVMEQRSMYSDLPNRSVLAHSDLRQSVMMEQRSMYSDLPNRSVRSDEAAQPCTAICQIAPSEHTEAYANP